ncbi:MAG: DUF2946 family protein [Burkholderiales bacterium]|nr:DUF2946 family protein [Burkholderiales bacterium]MDE2396999.1 DUF2946 family protein [Burkholderiales bacterium]MDE2455836.1 DUF2946 family protein [Burkholderiales bacterium]
MDEIVEAALRKWPNVPHCHGWLALDARGNWYLRDERAQAAGPFPAVRGSRVEHEKLLAFIGRNYAADGEGAWYFQNGPQRVYVELEAAPWVWRLDARGGVESHTGRAARVESVWLDEQGRLFLATDLGCGIVHTLDMEAASEAIESGRWQPRELAFAAMPGRFGYRLKPARAGG